MPDPITAVALAYISKEFLSKLFGPTAEYWGDGLKNLFQKRQENVARIFKNAETKLGGKINESGEISPRILAKIINEASFVNDELSAEYFGGILASSRSNNNRDDRGAGYINAIEGLSVYQMRTHYILYMGIKNIFKGSNYQFNLVDRPKMEIFIPEQTYTNAMDFTSDELGRVDALYTHTFFGLLKAGYIDNFEYGGLDYFKKRYKNLPDDGIIFTPSALGVELFLWAHGHGDLHVSELLDPELDLEILKGVVLPIDSMSSTSQFK